LSVAALDAFVCALDEEPIAFALVRGGVDCPSTSGLRLPYLAALALERSLP